MEEGSHTGSVAGDSCLLLTEQRCSGELYAKLPEHTGWHRYYIEANLAAIHFRRTYRPSLFASKVTETFEFALERMSRPRWENVAQHANKSNCFCVTLKPEGKLYIQARNHTDLMRWVECLQNNLLKNFCGARLNSGAAAAPRTVAFWGEETVLYPHLPAVSLVTELCAAPGVPAHPALR